MSMKLTDDMINAWADDPKGPVALHMTQALLPVEGEGGVIFPPTYADSKNYGVEELSDGRTVVTIDSVGSQANRIEPIFRRADKDMPENELAALVPQIEIRYGEGKTVSILEVGHRLGDALVRSSTLREQANQAFAHLLDTGDASQIAKLAPTSLVFGAWDSRDTQAKLPRILQSVIRAWDVDVIKRSAQYSPPINYTALEIFDEEQKKQADNPKSPLAQAGFAHVPASEALGGVVARGPIERHVTVNLIALRRLRGDGENSQALRRYILGLALVGATEPLDGFLRQGCLLSGHPSKPPVWQAVERDGKRSDPLELDQARALAYAKTVRGAFPVVEDAVFEFSKELAHAAVDAASGKSAKGKDKAKAKAK